MNPLLRLAQSAPDEASRARYLSAYTLHALREDVSACTACTLRAGCPAPTLPNLPGQAPSYLTVISETPEFSRSAEALFRYALMRHVGIPWEKVCRLSMVQCQPAPGTVPTKDQTDTCTGKFTMRGLAATKSQIVIVLRERPGRALEVAGDSLAYDIGSGWEADGRLWFVLAHPQTVLSTPSVKPGWELDLMLIGRLVHTALVKAAAAIFRHDSTWPGLVDGLHDGLPEEFRIKHKLEFVSRVIGETGCHPAAIERAQQPDLFGMTITEMNQHEKAKANQ